MADIDAVIMWVDGADPAHAEKRRAYLPDVVPSKGREVSGFKEVRFIQHDEVRYCVRSIKNHAPWIRKIWIVTDNQFPACFDQEEAERNGVFVVDHRHIFRDFEYALPTFNSQSIESMIWRIDGLAEQFIYFNDDMILTAPVKPEDFFEGDKLKLRGLWKVAQKAERNLHRQCKVNGAKLAGYPSKFFHYAHVMYPMLVSAQREAYEKRLELLAFNVAFRFRSTEQFISTSYHYHLLFKAKRVIKAATKPVVHFSMAMINDAPKAEIIRNIRRMKRKTTFAACVNDLGLVAKRVPTFVKVVDKVSGPPVSFERPTGGEAAEKHGEA